ncbi:hypothetical protein [Gordonia oryzae]|uniref:hypothetical protein n=1 Tax=Gordonia oryzae TaxID=2487349 RepID=UPI001FE6B259|nr:hypothetical protein [Gordonia oryzae]
MLRVAHAAPLRRACSVDAWLHHGVRRTDRRLGDAAAVGHYFGQVSAAVYTAAGDYETSDAALADRFGRVPAPGRA